MLPRAGSLLVLGGYAEDDVLQRDIWTFESEASQWFGEYGGDFWTRLPDAPWMPSTGVKVAQIRATGELLLVLGGIAEAGPSPSVWASRDSGAAWQARPDAPWPGRAHFGVCATSSGLLVLGGLGETGYLRDVWRLGDNEEWTSVGEAPWAARAWFEATPLDGACFVLGGYSDAGQLNDVWRLDDGTASEWAQMPNASWAPRYGHKVVTRDSSILVVAGYERREVDTARKLMENVCFVSLVLDLREMIQCVWRRFIEHTCCVSFVS